MVDPLRTGGIYRMKLASHGLDPPRPLLGASPRARTPLAAEQTASPRFTRPKPEVILHDPGAAMGTPAPTRFSPGFHAVALAAPVADVVRRAAEEHFSKQQRELEEQLLHPVRRQLDTPEQDEEVDFDLLRARQSCAPPWAADDPAPTPERTVTLYGARELVDVPGDWKSSSVPTTPHSRPLRNPADIFGVASPSATERKPAPTCKLSCAGDARDHVIASSPDVPQTLFSPAPDDASCIQRARDISEPKNSNAEPSELVAATPAIAARADSIEKQESAPKDPLPVARSPESGPTTAPSTGPRKRGKLSEVLRLQRSIATAVWTDSVAVSELSEPILAIDVDDDGDNSPLEKGSKSTPRRTRSTATIIVDGPGSARSLRHARHAVRAKPLGDSDEISRVLALPSRSRRGLTGRKRHDVEFPSMNRKTSKKLDTSTKEGRRSRSSNKQKIAKRPMHKFDRTIKSAIKTPSEGKE